VRRSDGKLRKYRPKWLEIYFYLRHGEEFEQGDLVAGCVAPAEVSCPGATWDWVGDLASLSQDDRYAAIKASRFLSIESSAEILRSIAENDTEDWRLRLEAAGALTAVEPERWIDLIAESFADPGMPDERQMEAMFVLSEVNHPYASEALRNAAQPAMGRKSEVRAAGVWGLGLGARQCPEEVGRFLDDSDDLVALHAAAALPTELPSDVVDQLSDWLREDSPRRVAMAAHMLAHHGHFDILVDVSSWGGTLARLLAIRTLGDLSRADVEHAVGPLDEKLTSLLMPIWAQRDDWLRKPETEGGIDALEMQRVRL
jgi:hypothetical protein